ncbi:glycoprotein antigen BM86 [Folsomia candida]|uniref:glycoprotein antigen BM86 n=1 Tax=Folsomia candida TaxID=158441 RepID=UPI000B904913|nr:glycoprotein antigen BM86 [Folsomia candida]
MKHIILFLYTVATVTQGVLGARDQCNSTVPCPLSNGYQMDCKYEFGGGIGCACKRCFCPGNTQQFTYHGCVPRPKIGESCGYQNVTVGCLTSRAICTVESGNTCQCISMHVDDPPHYPSHDLERCIPKPVLLDQPCSIAAPCDNIPGAVCGVAHQCACASDSYPHEDGRSCIQAPRIVGDLCSQRNTCDRIPYSECITGQDGDLPIPSDLPTCQCRPLYQVPHLGEADRCLPTEIGLSCSDQAANCDLIHGARCHGSEARSMCLCPKSLPNLEFTKCNKK